MMGGGGKKTIDNRKSLKDLASSLRIGDAFRGVETSSVPASIPGHLPPSTKLGLSGRDNPFCHPPFKYKNVRRKARILVQDEILWRDFNANPDFSEVKTRVGTNMVLLKFVTSRIRDNDKLKRDATIKNMGSQKRGENYIGRVLSRGGGCCYQWAADQALHPMKSTLSAEGSSTSTSAVAGG